MDTRATGSMNISSSARRRCAWKSGSRAKRPLPMATSTILGRGDGSRCHSRRSCAPGRKPPSPRRSRWQPLKRRRLRSPANLPRAAHLVVCSLCACRRRYDCCKHAGNYECRGLQLPWLDGRRKSMTTLYLTEEYALVRRESEGMLLVQIPARQGKDGVNPAPARSERIPLNKIDEVIVLGEITLTASAMHLLLEPDIEITFLGRYGQFKGRLSPPFSKNAILRMAQYRAHQDMGKRCELARRFVIGKLMNQRTMLQRSQRRQADAEMKQAIEQINTLLRQLAALPLDSTHVPHKLASGDNRIAGTPLEAILGMEGAGSAAYFGCFGNLLSDPKQWPFPGRVKRPPTDPVNALLSFGYSLLTNRVASAVQVVGFDHFVGYLHSSFYGRPALALDLVEEFRPIIVDSVVLNMLNHRMLSADDFVVELGAYRLKQERRKVFFTKFEERLNEEVQHPLFGYKSTYHHCIELQSRLLAKYLTGEIDAYPPLRIR